MRVKIKDKTRGCTAPAPRVVENFEQLDEGDAPMIFRDSQGDTCIVARHMRGSKERYTVIWLDAGRNEYPVVVRDVFPLTMVPEGTKITLKQED